MEFVSKIKWVIITFVFLFALIFIGWGLSAIARSVFDDSSSPQETVEVEPIDVTAIKSVRFIVEGPIVASEDQRSYTIDVSERVVSMKVFSDYGEVLIVEKSYVNNSEAYESLIHALDRAGAALRYKDTTEEDDYSEKGACPTGKRYVIELGDFERRWTTSCSNVRGTLGGRTTTIRSLFNKQIPDFKDLVEGTTLR